MSLCPLCHESTEDVYNEHRYCPSVVDSSPVPFLDGAGEPVWFVSVFWLTRSYGGPEEGGWYYDEGPRVAVFVASTWDEAHDIRYLLDREQYRENGPGDVFVTLTRGLPEGPWYSTYAPWE